MRKRIVICADGTWNRPEEDPSEDTPTNVLRLARAIKPVDGREQVQQVFYDWGIGADHDRWIGGLTGRGLNKKIMDSSRYIVQNYSSGSELFLFGFSRGAYTIRCLCGLIYNCGIVKRPDAALIQEAFDRYRRRGALHHPSGESSAAFRAEYSHPSREIAFVGVWDTVGAMGIPCRFLGLFDDRDEFHNAKIGPNVRVARHALAIDQHRIDFEPTIWEPQPNMDMEQVWFSGAHADVGGGYGEDGNGNLLSDIPLDWLVREARKAGLKLEPHLRAKLDPVPTAHLHRSRKSFYRLKEKYDRPIDHGRGDVLIHRSVKRRWISLGSGYRPPNLRTYL